MVTSFNELKSVFFSGRRNKNETEATARIIWHIHQDWIPGVLKECLNNKVNRSYRLRAAWLLTIGFDLFPSSYYKYEEEVISTMLNVKHSSERRSLVRIVALHGHTKEHDEVLLNWLFELILDGSEAIAVKAHAMAILERIVCRIPELANEFAQTLDSQWQNASPGIKNRIKHTKKRMKKKGLI